MAFIAQTVEIASLRPPLPRLLPLTFGYRVRRPTSIPSTFIAEIMSNLIRLLHADTRETSVARGLPLRL